ncbi:MAG: YwaF family protein [Christensenellaceae bacterium]|jgi:ABC-2 type transport system ATP-binding protein|nr:YwaF family protein [Christensenellaceae bacterium]
MLFYIYQPALIVFAALLVVCFCLMFLKKPDKQSKFFKTLALVLAGLFFLRYMSGHNYLESIVALTNPEISSDFLTSVVIVLDWLNIAAMFIVVLNAFFDIKINKFLIMYFVVPVALCNAGFLYWSIIGLSGTTATYSFDAKTLFYVLEQAALLGIALCFAIKYRKFKMTAKEVGIFFACLFGILLCTMPAYSLRALFGGGPSVEILDFTLSHRIAIYLGFVFPAVLFFLLKNKDYETKRYVIIFIALSTLTTFLNNFLLSDMLNLSLPLHLCHTAMYILVISLIFKMKRLFYFTLFINVLGAFLAILMPDYSSGTLFAPGYVIFWVNHWTAFFMPLLTVMLGVFGRPKWKQFMYSMIAFGVYFFLIIFINAWFSNYLTKVDYFFVNSNFVAEKLGKWAEDLLLVVAQFKIGDLSFTLYPLYQVLFFFVYCAMGVGIWFIYETAYDVGNSLVVLFEKKKKIKMDELALSIQIKERGSTTNKEGEDMLKITNFSKKYGNSEKFAVTNANLEVHGGEIFGFLGPNGAGKSTIIKSVVGIQPITSGKIEVCGYDVEKQSVDAKYNIGFVPDHYALYERLTGREYINYMADLYKVSKENRDNRIQHFVDIFELNHAFDNQIKTYSHGMKQKIAIMAALIHEPKLWILDEPLTGLDPNSIYQVKETMKAHAKKGNIVFFSSHIIDVVENICDRIAIIKKGKIIYDTSMKDLSKDGKRLEEVYLSHIGSKGAERD